MDTVHDPPLTPAPLTEAQALAALEAHGYRNTAPRRAVVTAVLRRDRPFSAEHVVEELPGIARATVYRTLEILAAVDLLTRLLRADGRPAYVVGRPGHRHHLVCSGCGEIMVVTGCPVDQLVSDLAKRTAWTVEGHHLEMFGRCPACQRDNHAGH